MMDEWDNPIQGVYGVYGLWKSISGCFICETSHTEMIVCSSSHELQLS